MAHAHDSCGAMSRLSGLRPAISRQYDRNIHDILEPRQDVQTWRDADVRGKSGPDSLIFPDVPQPYTERGSSVIPPAEGGQILRGKVCPSREREQMFEQEGARGGIIKCVMGCAPGKSAFEYRLESQAGDQVL